MGEKTRYIYVDSFFHVTKSSSYSLAIEISVTEVRSIMDVVGLKVQLLLI